MNRSFHNSENEKISIREVTKGPFTGKHCLIIHDDGPLGTEAPMLLDEQTQGWLMGVIQELRDSGGNPR